MKEKIIKLIREVPIADKDYGEYVDAVAERLTIDTQKYVREIFEEIEKFNRPPLPECKSVYIIKASELAELKKKYGGEYIDVCETI